MRRAAAIVAVAAPLALGGCGARHATVAVDPVRSASDESLRIVARGLPRDAPVSVEVTSTDATGARWSSFATLHATDAGVVDIPMSVVDRLEPSARNLTSFYAWPEHRSARFVIQVTSRGKTRAKAVFERKWLAHPVAERSLSLRGAGIAGRFFAPSAAGRHPALLLFGGSEGGLAPYGLFIARQLASHGVAVLDVAYWSYPGLPSSLDRIPLEYFARGLRWLGRQKDVDASRVDVEGISYGSEAALLLGVHYPRLVHAVVASVPSNLATECYGGACNGTDPAWTFDGRGITPFTAISVERIRGPVLAICGTKDLIWPSCPQAQAIMSRRRAHHLRYSDTLIVARGAGHYVGATVPYQVAPPDQTYTQQDVDEAGAERVWPKLVWFLGGTP